MESAFSGWGWFKRKKRPWLRYLMQTGVREAGGNLPICACSALPWEFDLLDQSDTFPLVPAREGVRLPLEIVTRTAALR